MKPLIILSSDLLRVAINPQYGARLVNLLDIQAGREWLTQGGTSPDVGEDARYGSREAVGWDECFPTVSVCDATHTAWGRRLRDHGDVWGRPWEVVSSDPQAACLRFSTAEFIFERTLTVSGGTLTCDYAVTERRGLALPYLWALHALLAADAGDRIEIPGLQKARPTYLSTHSSAAAVGELDWHGPNAALTFPLDVVQPRSSGFAAKFLASGDGRRARVGRPGSWLQFGWDNGTPAIGIWLTYGGWPGPGGHQEIAIEPTSAAADDLLQAIEGGAAPLAPHETRRWQVTLTVSR